MGNSQQSTDDINAEISEIKDEDEDDNKEALAVYQSNVYDNNMLTLQMQKEKEQSSKISPQFMKVMPKDHSFKIHIAIDFGTDGMGIICLLQYST